MSTLPAVYDQIDERTLEILEHRRRVGGVQRRGWLVRRALLVADVVGLWLAFVIAEQVFGGGISRAGHLGTPGEYVLFAISLPAWVVAAKLYGLYDKDEERTDHSTTDDFAGVFHLVTVVTWLLYAFSRVTPEKPELQKLLVFWLAAVAIVPLARVGARAYARRQIAYIQNTVVVGAGDVGQLVARKLLQHPEYGINLVGFVDADPKELQADLGHLAHLGCPGDLRQLVGLLDVERVIFAFSTQSHAETLDLIRDLRDLDVQIDVVPRLFEIVGPNFGVHTVEGLPLVGLPPFRLSRSSRLLKRSMDLLVAVPLLIALFPPAMLVALLIKLDSQGPVFFRQTRVGAGDREFQIWKFRTMVADADARKEEVAHLNKHVSGDPRMFKIPNDPRATRIGMFLRKFSLDEFPQLLNVVRGEMSLVGPRPLILAEDSLVNDWGRRRLSLKPGITGPWQVLGASDIPFGEMVRLDYLYVTGWSLRRDIVILFRTIPLLIKASGNV